MNSSAINGGALCEIEDKLALTQHVRIWGAEHNLRFDVIRRVRTN